MLLRDTLACSVPNSSTPVSAAFLEFMANRNAAASALEGRQFADWLAMLDRSPASFEGVGMDWRNFAWPNPGIQTLNLTPGAGNGVYDPRWGYGGAGGPGGAGGGAGGAGGGAGGGGGSPFGSAAVCSPTFEDAPEVIEMGGGPGWPDNPPPVLVTVPMNPPVLRPPAPGPVPVAPVAPVAPAPAPGRPAPTGRICDDLRAGAVLQSQVSTEQLWACAQAGYQGAGPSGLDVTAAGAGGRLPYLGTPDPSPAPAGGMGAAPDNTALELLFAAGALAGLFYVLDQWPKMTRGRR